MAATPHDLSALVSLLKESAELAAPAGSSGGEATSSGPVRPQEKAQTASVVRFGGLCAPAAAAAGGGGGAPPQAPPGFDAQSLWAPEEVLTVHVALAAPNPADARRRPEFDFGYKQRVGSEDVFLGLAGTTESSIHCDTLVMRVQLPGERLSDIDLDCTEDRIVVSAAQQCVARGLTRPCCRACAQCGLGCRVFLLFCARAAASPPPHPPAHRTPAPPQQARHLSAQQGLSQERRGQVGRCALCASHLLPPGQV